MINSNLQKIDETSGGSKRTNTEIVDPQSSKRQKASSSTVLQNKKNSIQTQFLPISSSTLIKDHINHQAPKTFKAFLASLRQYSQGVTNDAFTKYLSKEDLIKIFDYFDNNTAKNPTVKSFGKQISTLLPNQILILNKKDTGLPHTLKITRSEEGVFELFLECLMAPKTFKDFIYNIKESQLHSPCQDLLKLISHEDLKKIYDYFSDNIQKNPTVREFGEKISKLAPNESVRLDKHKTKLPRTLNVVRTDKNEFLLLLETKSKLADGTKQTLPQMKGTFKSGKSCWRIDSGEIEYFNLVSHLKKDKNFQNIKNEVHFSQKFDSQYIDIKQLGEKFEKNGLSKVSLYAEKSNCGSLTNFLKSKEYHFLTISQKYELLIDICNGIKVLHDQNFVHQDIKPDNILIKGNPQMGYHAILTDFGMIDIHDNPDDWARATQGYQSPEITANFQYPDPKRKNYTYFYEYFNAKQYCPTLSHQLLPLTGHKTPHKANDLWALGIVAYIMLYQKLPILPEAKINIEGNTLLNGLLEKDRNKRFTIEQAMDVIVARTYEKFGL